MTEPTEEQLKQLHKDIMSGLVMIVEVEHYKKLEDNLNTAYGRIKELEAILKEFTDAPQCMHFPNWVVIKSDGALKGIK